MMERSLEGKVALVLGAIKGIGKAIALTLAEQGAFVVVNYHDWEEDLPALERDLARYPNRHLILQNNLLDTACIPQLIQTVIARCGRLDILINNVERGGWPVVHGPYIQKQWDLELETTLRAKRWVFDQALPHLKASGDAVVINLSSISGLVGRSGPASYVFNDGYAAANRGISLLTETWARMGAPEVRVNEVMVGFVETRHGPQTRGWGLLSKAQQQAILSHTLLQRIGRIADVVKAVMFLIQDAPFMTGSLLRIDGGYVLGGSPVAAMPEGIL
jgi:3-oxoacyl-[acyl-carrier protein] reductase